MEMRVKKMVPDAVIPQYAHPGDAGMDLYASQDISVNSQEIARIPTGIAVHIPEGHVGLVWDRSGLAIKFGLKTLGGVIDSGYRGEVMVGIINLGKESYAFKKGERVAQLLIQKVERVQIEEVESLDESVRGEGGFGSTGK